MFISRKKRDEGCEEEISKTPVEQEDSSQKNWCQRDGSKNCSVARTSFLEVESSPIRSPSEGMEEQLVSHRNDNSSPKKR